MEANHFIEFSKPFITAAKNVFETMAFTKLEPHQPVIKKNNKSQGDISSIMGITGVKDGNRPFKGMLVISWPNETYLKVASAMLMEEYQEYSDEISDVGGEISNMIMGNAKRELATMGYKADMAIPSMIKGNDHSINYPPNTTVIQIPINSAHGQMFMEICYTEA